MNASALRRLALASTFLFFALLVRAAAPTARTVLPFDSDWRFSLGDPAAASTPAFADSGWSTVNLPHDWSIAGPFSETNPTTGSGAFLPAGVGWYRKSFTAPKEWAGKQVSVEFDGIMAHSDVWLNGKHLGNRPYGYVSFAYDVTGAIKPGETNVLAVRADNSAQPASRWYSGAGIYRHVRIVVTESVHVAHWGVAVTTPVATAERALVRVAIHVANDGATPAHPSVAVILRDARGRVAAKGEISDCSIEGHASKEVMLELAVRKPQLWELEKPALYQAEVQVSAGRTPLDATAVTFGIRDAHFEAETGFWLNGRNIKLKGVAIHADASALGVAVPREAWEHKLRLLREIGANAIRAAHNPFDPDFLDTCDRMGFVVMDELFDCWTVAKNPYDYSRDFLGWSVTDVRDTVMRDRNHPSIILYSAGNEIHDTPQEEHAKQILASLVAAFHEADPSRPVTQALFRPNVSHDYDNGLADMLDVIGTNYRFNEVIAAHVAKPTRKIIGTENGHEIRAWLAVRDDPAYSGEFIWTGIDYLGESPKWPQVSSNSGLIDRIGEIRPVGRQFESWWSSHPMVSVVRRIAPSSGTPTDPGFDAVKRRTVLFADWNPADPAPHPETVEVYSNCPTVTLYLNGKSLGVKNRAALPAPQPESAWTRAKREDPSADDPDAPRVWKVDYVPGQLEAVGSGPNQPPIKAVLRTASAPAQISLSSDGLPLGSSWDSIVYVTATIQDAHGVPVPHAAENLTFSVKGGSLVAVDSADNASHESFAGPSRTTFEGRCVALIRANPGAKTVTITATGPGLGAASLPLLAQ